MSPAHGCTQLERIDRHDAELYHGHEGRQPVVSRMSRVEDALTRMEGVAKTLAAFGFTILAAVLIGAGTVIYKTVTLANDLKSTTSFRPTMTPAPQYEAAPVSGRN
jgi:hypothetical protein